MSDNKIQKKSLYVIWLAIVPERCTQYQKKKNYYWQIYCHDDQYKKTEWLIKRVKRMSYIVFSLIKKVRKRKHTANNRLINYK